MSDFFTDKLDQIFNKDSNGLLWTIETISIMFPTFIPTVKKDLFLGWESKDEKISAISRKLFSRRPYVEEFQLFAHRVEVFTKDKQNTSSSIEASAMQQRKEIVANGTVLKVGNDMYQMVPIPHLSSVKLTEWDEYAIAYTSMMISVQGGVLKNSLTPSVISSGPLKLLMTPESYVGFYTNVIPILEKWGVHGEGDVFSRSLYEGAAKALPADRHALRHHLYKLFAPAEIKVDVMEGTVRYNSTVLDMKFDKAWDKVEQVGPDGRKTVFRIPRGVGMDIKNIAVPSIPKTEKNRDNCCVMVDHINSRIPNALIKAFSYRGCPDKNQRLFMELRPFIGSFSDSNVDTTTTNATLVDSTSTNSSSKFDGEVHVVVDPPVMLERWMKANSLSNYVRTAGSTFLPGTLSPDEVPVVIQEYKKGSTPAMIVKDEKPVIRKALYYGKIEYDHAFWINFKLLIYRPSPKGVFVYCPIGYSPPLPRSYAGWPLQIVSSPAQHLKVLMSLMSTLTKCVFKGTYFPRGAQYANLNYPMEKREYEHIDITGDLQYEQAVGGNFKPTKYSSVSCVDADDETQLPDGIAEGYKKTERKVPEKRELKYPADYLFAEMDYASAFDFLDDPKSRKDRYWLEFDWPELVGTDSYDLLVFEGQEYVLLGRAVGGYFAMLRSAYDLAVPPFEAEDFDQIEM